MKGKHKVVIKNNRLHYEFEIKRNITIIKGDSATGKTTLINMIRQFTNLGNSSGIELVCDVPCRVLEGIDWQIILHNISGNIIFIDEENAFIKTEQFAKAVRESDNYFVLITRENLYNLPYSVEEIYGLKSCTNEAEMVMSYKQLMKKYIWLLFCSIITMLVSGYVYINHYFSFIMLIGVTCSIGSTIELISLIITTHKGNKEE